MTFSDLPHDTQRALVRAALHALLDETPSESECLTLCLAACDAIDTIEWWALSLSHDQLPEMRWVSWS
jgi:hypothetical protein